MCEEMETWRVCHCGVGVNVYAVIRANREPEGKEILEIKPWPDAWEVYSRRSWRLFAVTGKAGFSWSDFVVVVDAIVLVDGDVS